MGKKERHAAIMELIQQKELETQEDLIQALLEQGISVTQATISRDIRELQLVKQHLENGVCCYRLPEQTPISDHLLRDAILRTDYAGQIAVLHCRSGTAQAICAAVDAKQTIALWERLPEMIPFLFCCGQKNRLPFSQNNMQFGCKRKKGKRYAERTLY